MTACRFLDDLTFRSLIAPVTEEEFRACYWERKPLIVHRRDRDYYGDLFNLRDFDAALTRSPSYIKVNHPTAGKGTSWQVPTTQGLEAVLAGMHAGGTLILDQLHRCEPKLGLFCRVLGQELGHTFETSLYLTPPRGKSSVPHWDNTDVFILQVLGTKHWRIENERRVFPIRPHKMGEDVREFREECTSVTVCPGDLIYIPRGFMHIAECESEASLHISVGLVPVVLEELLHAVIKAAVQRYECLRVALPLGFMQGDGDDVITDAMTALRAAAEEPFIRAVFDQFRDELVQAAVPDTSDQVVEFFESRPLTLENIVGSRRGVVWRMHTSKDLVRLNVGTRSIVFPGIFHQALGFALTTPVFPVRALPGKLGDEERIAFVERLLEEGLVVRRDREVRVRCARTSTPSHS